MEYTTKDIQNSILSIIKDVDKFCQDNDIKYYLMGGSALGAMRHKGFIPWDDDLDVFMTVDNYRKFLSLFEKATKENKEYNKYFLQKEDTKEWPIFLSRVCLTGTTLISDEFKSNMLQHHNVFVDIMCLYSAPDNSLAHRIQFYTAQVLRLNALGRLGFKSSPIKNVVIGVCKCITRSRIKQLLIKGLNKYEGVNTVNVGHYFGRARYNNASFLREYIGNEPRYVDFEDTRLPVFEKVEDYLTVRYGDKWMEMPSDEVKAQYPVHGNFVDLENDYTKYIDTNGNWTV